MFDSISAASQKYKAHHISSCLNGVRKRQVHIMVKNCDGGIIKILFKPESAKLKFSIMSTNGLVMGKIGIKIPKNHFIQWVKKYQRIKVIENIIHTLFATIISILTLRI